MIIEDETTKEPLQVLNLKFLQSITLSCDSPMPKDVVLELEVCSSNLDINLSAPDSDDQSSTDYR